MCSADCLAPGDGNLPGINLSLQGGDMVLAMHLCASDLCLCILGMRRLVVGPRPGVLFETAIATWPIFSGVLDGSA